MDYILRPMSGDDVFEVEKLERACFSDPWSERTLREMLESGFDEAWVLELSGGGLAGYANFRFLAGEGELMRIAVFPEFRGRGLGRKLMERLDISAREQGAAELTLEVRAGNLAARGLYEAFGFQAEAVRKAYYRDPVEDAVIMWRHGEA